MSRGKQPAPASASMTRAQRALAASSSAMRGSSPSVSSAAHGPLGSGPRKPRPSLRALTRRSTTFARAAFGRAGPAELRRAQFVLAEVPLAAVKSHLQRREPPPPLVDELIARTYHAIVGGGPSGNADASASMR